MTKVTNTQLILPQYIKEERARFPKDLSDSDFFEIFAAQQVLKEYELSDIEIQNGIVGSGLDGGVDGFYFFINGQPVQEDIPDYEAWKKNIHIEVFLIQAKTTSGFGEDAILRLVNTSQDLFSMGNKLTDKKFKERYNPELLETANRLKEVYLKLVTRKPTLQFKYFYVTQGEQVHPNTKNLTEKLGRTIQEQFPGSQFSFTFVGSRELLESVSKRPAEQLELPVIPPVVYSGNDAAVCLTKLRDFYLFIKEKNTDRINRHIFEANVRDYQGDVVVNKDIRDSLEKPDKENFWWLNNGITILASNMRPMSNASLLLESPEIVNGLQTSNELFKYFSQIGEEEIAKDERDILLRIIVPPDGKSRDKIIKATNNQTKIPPYALKATDPVHWEIEQYFLSKNLYYDRRKNYYKNQGKPKEQIVTITELAQAMIAIKLRRPEDARARPSTILDSENEYTKVFERSINLELYHAVLQIMKKVNDYLATAHLSQNEKTNLRYYIAHYATCLSCSKAFPNEDDILEASKKIDVTILAEALIELQPLFVAAGGDDTAAKGRDFIEAITTKLRARFIPATAKVAVRRKVAAKQVAKERVSVSPTPVAKKKAAAKKKTVEKEKTEKRPGPKKKR